jgi:hypothetical protein
VCQIGIRNKQNSSSGRFMPSMSLPESAIRISAAQGEQALWKTGFKTGD